MERYQENYSAAQPFAGIVENQDGALSLTGLANLKNCRMISPYGIYAKPCSGDLVGAIPVEGFGYLLMGQVQDLSDLQEGEIRLVGKGGAEIRLMTDGEIWLNGLIITKDGTIKEKSSG